VDGLILSAAQWLDAVGIGPWAREGALTYPIANTLHLLGLVMLVGGIAVVDLRVLGLWQRLPLEALSRALTPVAVMGFVIMVPTGVVLFAADGQALAGSDIFERKLVLIVLALANAAAFRVLFGRRLSGWGGVAPHAARMMAALSLLLWLAVGTLGRFIAYG
jgi:hypothetical protein